MDFQLHSTGNNFAVKTATTDGIHIGENIYTHSILLTAGNIESLNEIQSLEDISNEVLEKILVKHPDVILIGTGSQAQRPSSKQNLDWLNAGVGIETMDTQAACRTFNLLMSEDREVAAILLPLV